MNLTVLQKIGLIIVTIIFVFSLSVATIELFNL